MSYGCPSCSRYGNRTFRPFTGRFAPWTFRQLDVSPSHWTFRPHLLFYVFVVVFFITVSIHTAGRMHSVGESAYGRTWYDILLTYLITI